MSINKKNKRRHGSRRNLLGRKGAQFIKKNNLDQVKILQLAVVVLLAFIFLLLLFVVMGMFLNSDKRNATVDTAVETSYSEEVLLYYSQRIKGVLFDYGVTVSDIRESVLRDEQGNPVLHMGVSIRYGHTNVARRSVVGVFDNSSFVVYLSDAITAVSKSYKIIIEFMEKEEIVPIIDPEPEETYPTVRDDVFNIPIATNSPRIAIILDDAGHDLRLARRLAKLDYPITLAILPNVAYSAQTASIMHESGKEVFLHLPMEPHGFPNVDPGPGALMVNMPSEIIEQLISKGIESLGGLVDGVNNHMGSKFTEDTEKMQQVLLYVGDYTDLFVDSHTSIKTVAYDECIALGLICGKNGKFLDNNDDVAYIKSKLIEAAQAASRNGSIIAIGHLRTNTVVALEEALPVLVERGYVVSFVREAL